MWERGRKSTTKYMQSNRRSSEAKGQMHLLSWEDIQKMKYSWNVASEVMRLTTAAPRDIQGSSDRLQLRGYSIPKGWKIYWTVSSTSCNTEYFTKPDVFDPDRFGDGQMNTICIATVWWRAAALSRKGVCAGGYIDVHCIMW
ncbi:unnamed protein product [Rhodiola kirilowii]